jgi:heme/copper-type cytochrome/quinol oxidase subunit 2
LVVVLVVYVFVVLLLSYSKSKLAVAQIKQKFNSEKALELIWASCGTDLAHWGFQMT